MADEATGSLCGCLRRIAVLLEKGNPVEAAAVVCEMNEVLSRGGPTAMSESEYAEARSLLALCEKLERDARQDVLVSLQRLAATRKSSIYRRFGSDP